MRLNWPGCWPTPPPGWTPPAGWRPPSTWPEPPVGWQLWIDEVAAEPVEEPAATQYGPPLDPGSEEHRQTPGTPDETELLRARIRSLEAELAAARGRGGADAGGLVELDDQRALQDVGIYRYHHPLEDAPAYKERLDDVEARIDMMVKDGRAVLAADMFTWNGSLARGRQLVRDLSKLMLRAYNAEADNCVRSLRAGNIGTATTRLGRSVQAVEKLGSMMELRINPEYHALRVEELELVADYRMKLQEEREQAREQRELLREQRRVEAELAAERARLDKERAHYVSALAALEANGDAESTVDLTARLVEIDSAIESNDYRVANIRAGYVYVISNIGAFGPQVVKIGMTRRIEPRDRVRELSGASVPFQYDVHALFFSDDAVTLENELHKAFAARRVNCANFRREFFFATPSEVRAVLAEKVGGLLEYTETPDASEYHQSFGSWPAELTAAPGDHWRVAV
ncbi:T5orf172 domain-containing protein [Austwickia chelonae]|uniref:Bacteriophage T5 Orf172 DNA-binding domain-containing protein n=1 Tax=Austwickia chelonae NBRC 105200 TaxID=1184607 RepID=K6VTU8_9MICO|nr:DUF4041 domain-containing protein [Austwickia chelonae]GAB78770.1 hypothetical protein AUCHE_16_01930 [Austwickia chelonae NBRC 105200]SEW35329.1 T5orf172 domain-containing protein [Austwickia chelonae]